MKFLGLTGTQQALDRAQLQLLVAPSRTIGRTMRLLGVDELSGMQLVGGEP